ncbi:MAG TPA: AAA family ATPase [Candidatus Bathyarchaeia archaeon]|nr:AAA family ATPase [Candidatus Bathyarchaeia archaeon]
MYKQFFGLTKNPFEISPDPFFYHATPRHNEALANLHYGVGRRKGFIVITGEVGTGKTLLVRCLLAELRKNNIAFGYVFNPLLSTIEFFQYIMADLGLQYSGRSKTEMLLDLNRFLIQRHARGLITALVVDEAQALRPELLEEIRLLTNLETSQQKLLQIVLMGQPELEGVLDSPSLRQLKQRVSLRCQLLPLDEEQTGGYVVSRLQRAGAKAEPPIFNAEALARIYEYSRGIPRIINTLCENAMVNAFARELHTVTPDMIAEVAADFRLSDSPSVPEELAEGNAIPEDSNESLLRSLFRLLRTMDNAQPPDEKSIPSADGRRI